MDAGKIVLYKLARRTLGSRKSLPPGTRGFPRRAPFPPNGALFVNHSQDEWVVGEFHTHSAEGYFSHFKRSVRGTHTHISEKHLHRYLAEFDFRYSNRAKLGVDDERRTERALRGIVGKRLTYRRTRGARPQSDEAPY